MNDRIALLIAEIGWLEADLEAGFAKHGAVFNFYSEQGRVVFEAEVLRLHKERKTSLGDYILNARLLAVLS